MSFEMKPNPNFKAEVMKAAQEKLSKVVAPAKAVLLTEKEALQQLLRREPLSNVFLGFRALLMQVLHASMTPVQPSLQVSFRLIAAHFNHVNRVCACIAAATH